MKKALSLAAFVAITAAGGLFYFSGDTPQTASEPGAPSREPLVRVPEIAETNQAKSDGLAEPQAVPEPEYVYGMDQSNTQGHYIRYTLTRRCVAGYAETLSGEQWPMDDCDDTVLSTDHPYGSYTIEQLEYAANVMKDADAAYLLGLRFSWEPAHNRRKDAHRYLFGAFLLGAPESVFADIVQEQGYTTALQYTNGELDRDHFEASYIMNRVGEHFGAFDDRTQFFREQVGDDSVDFGQLEQDALALFDELSARRAEL